MQWFRLIWFWFFLAIAPLTLGSCKHRLSVTPQLATTSTPVATPSVVTPSVATPLTAPSPLGQASEAAIWSQLRQGRGYVILFRHALAPGTGDPSNFRLEDCSTQRNLSAAGRQQAVRMGELLRQQNIVVSRVLSSQWCRCLETAHLMAVGTVEPFPALNSFFQDRSTERSQTEQLRQFILENRDNTGVVVMVTHQVNITAISDVIPQSGAAIVLQASTSNQVEFVGQLASP